MDDTTTIRNWVADNRAAFDRWVSSATDRFWADTSVRLPRTPAERKNGMAAWLDACRVRLGASLGNEFRHCFPSPAALTNPALILELFDDYVWPEVEPTVRRYALRGLAAAWAGGHLGDATTLGWPEPDGRLWRVPLGVTGHGADLGQVTLDADGEVLPELTTSRSRLLEVIREPALPAAAAARQ